MRCRRTQINQLLATGFLAGIILPARADNPIAKELQRLRRTVLRPILWRIRAIQRRRVHCRRIPPRSLLRLASFLRTWFRRPPFLRRVFPPGLKDAENCFSRGLPLRGGAFKKNRQKFE